jgi:hypothetical protein
MTESCRLSPDQQADLTWHWCHAESELGVRSTTGNQISMLQARAMPEGTRAADMAARIEDEPLRYTDGRALSAKERKWTREDAEVRAVFQTLSIGGGSSGDCTRYRMAFAGSHLDGIPIDVDQVTYEPDWARIAGGAAVVRQRSRRVWGTLQRMKAKPEGVRHEFVLYRVYGPKTNVLQESKALARNEREIAELVPIFEYCPEITRRFDGSIDRRRVLELALRKPSTSLTRVLREQAKDVLADACGAYSAAAEHEIVSQRASKRSRVLRLMAAA